MNDRLYGVHGGYVAVNGMLSAVCEVLVLVHNKDKHKGIVTRCYQRMYCKRSVM